MGLENGLPPHLIKPSVYISQASGVSSSPLPVYNQFRTSMFYDGCDPRFGQKALVGTPLETLTYEM
jgi:hypothetical protein